MPLDYCRRYSSVGQRVFPPSREVLSTADYIHASDFNEIYLADKYQQLIKQFAEEIKDPNYSAQGDLYCFFCDADMENHNAKHTDGCLWVKICDAAKEIE